MMKIVITSRHKKKINNEYINVFEHSSYNYSITQNSDNYIYDKIFHNNKINISKPITKYTKFINNYNNNNNIIINNNNNNNINLNNKKL